MIGRKSRTEKVGSVIILILGTIFIELPCGVELAQNNLKKTMKTLFYALLKRIVELALVPIYLMTAAGCRQPNHTEPNRSYSFDNSRLYWCIEQIESGKIRRGMDTNSLRSIFGQSLDFYDRGEAYSFLTAPPKGESGWNQWPALWKIDFVISSNGIVTDFKITKSGDK